MNQNDMDRYYWRTGHRWSGDSRTEERLKFKVSGWAWTVLAVGVVVTYSILLFHR